MCPTCFNITPDYCHTHPQLFRVRAVWHHSASADPPPPAPPPCWMNLRLSLRFKDSGALHVHPTAALRGGDIRMVQMDPKNALSHTFSVTARINYEAPVDTLRHPQYTKFRFNYQYKFHIAKFKYKEMHTFK